MIKEREFVMLDKITVEQSVRALTDCVTQLRNGTDMNNHYVAGQLSVVAEMLSCLEKQESLICDYARQLAVSSHIPELVAPF